MKRLRPDIQVRFALRLVPRSHREYVAGDLEEGYAERAVLHGPARARLWLWRQAVKTLAPFLIPAGANVRPRTAGLQPGAGHYIDPIGCRFAWHAPTG